MGALNKPQKVCGRPSNSSLSPICLIYGPYLTSCELVYVPGRSMSPLASAADGVAARGHARGMRRAREAAAAACTAAARRSRTRFWRHAEQPAHRAVVVESRDGVGCHVCLGGGSQWPQSDQVVCR